MYIRNLILIPCIWPTVSSLSSLSTPANNNTLGAGIFKNDADNPLNQPNQCCSVFAKSIRQTYFLLVCKIEDVGGGGIFVDSSSSIISSRWITGSGLWSHEDVCERESMSWVANWLVSVLKR